MRAAEELNAILRHATGVAKAKPVAAFVRMLVESGERVLVYGWHRDVYDIWLEALSEFNPAMYTGSETSSAKRSSFERFRDNKTPVLIMSLRSGAGVDGLQHVCKTTVFGELDWSPGVLEQCEGRVYRDGQANPVFSYVLNSAAGTDPVMTDVLGVKQQQIAGLRDPDGAMIEQLSVDPDHIQKLAKRYLAGKGLPTVALPVATSTLF